MVVIPKIPRTYRDKIFVAFAKHEFGKFAPDSDETVFRLEHTGYRVTVNGQKCEARSCRVSALPFNRPWPGKQRPFSQSEEAAYVAFCADEAVTLRVACEDLHGEGIVRPLSRGIAVTHENGEFVFTLRKTGAYTLEIGGSHEALHIFFDPLKETYDAQGATYYFGPGLHFPGTLHLKDHDSVYIDREAIVFGSLFAEGAEDIRVFGGGVVDNSCEERITEHCYEPFNKGCVRFYDCRNVRIEDVILTNSCTWVLSLFECDEVAIDRIKIVGQWKYNTDGVDIVNSRNVLLKNSFIRAFDDVISIKGIYDCPSPIAHIHVEGCVLWCDWGHSCEIGVETAVTAYRNIVFSDCDVIHVKGPALAVEGGNHADIFDVLFENIRVELQKDTLPEVVQMCDAQRYDAEGKEVRPCLISISNEPYAIRTINSTDVVRKNSPQPGRIDGVTFRDIHVLSEEGVIEPELRVCVENEKECLGDMKIEGMLVNGMRCDNLRGFFENYRNFSGFLMA